MNISLVSKGTEIQKGIDGTESHHEIMVKRIPTVRLVNALGNIASDRLPPIVQEGIHVSNARYKVERGTMLLSTASVSALASYAIARVALEKSI